MKGGTVKWVISSRLRLSNPRLDFRGPHFSGPSEGVYVDRIKSSGVSSDLVI